MVETSATSFKALLALAVAPNGLSEGALRRACGSRVSKRELARVVADLEREGVVSTETRRGRLRARLTREGRQTVRLRRVPPRTRFSGKQVNALLALVGVTGATDSDANDLEERILAAHGRLARGPCQTATIAALRAELPGVDQQRLDAALLGLDRRGALVLGRAVDLGALTPAERTAAIEDEVRGLLLYVSSGRLSGGG